MMSLYQLSFQVMEQNGFVKSLPLLKDEIKNIVLRAYFNLPNINKWFTNYANRKKILAEKDNIVLRELVLFSKNGINNMHGINGLVHIAVFRNDANLLNILIECGIDMTQSNHQGYHPVFYAAYNKYINLLEIFLINKINILKKDRHGFTIIDYFDFNSYPTIKKLLLENYGIDISNIDYSFDSNAVHNLKEIMWYYNNISSVDFQTALDEISLKDLIKYAFQNNNVLYKIRGPEFKTEAFLKKHIPIDVMFDKKPLVYEVIYSDNYNLLKSFIENNVYIPDDCTFTGYRCNPEIDSFLKLAFKSRESMDNIRRDFILELLIDYGIDFYTKPEGGGYEWI